jgi:hypothetical protein
MMRCIHAGLDVLAQDRRKIAGNSSTVSSRSGKLWRKGVCELEGKGGGEGVDAYPCLLVLQPRKACPGYFATPYHLCGLS